MRALLVKTSSMGDVIHTFAAVTEARRLRPDLSLDWLVEEPFADIVRLHPGVGHIHRARVRDWRRSPLAAATLQAVQALSRDLRARRYDCVVDAQGLMKSAVLARLAGAPVYGYDRASVREPLASLFYAAGHRVPRDQHAIARTRQLFGRVFSYRPEGPSDPGLVLPAVRGPSRAVLLHGTSWAAKAWPIANWIATARGLSDRGLTPVTSWSSEEERRTAEALAAACPAVRVVPKSPLSVIAAEIAGADLVIGVDTGLMHLADAYGRNTVALFLGSSPDLTGPVGPRSITLPADAAALRSRPRRRSRQTQPDVVSVSPEVVLEAVDRLLLKATGP